jgi:hypothetical protein
MRRTIETAPRDGNAIILEDDVFGTYDVAHWSAEADEWVGENGEPSKIAPTHWYPLQGENYLQQGHDISSSPSLAEPSASRAHPSSAPVEAKRTPHARRGFAASSIAAALVAAALIGIYFRAEVGAYVARHTGQQRAEGLANELAEARRAIDGLNLQLQAGAMKTAQLLGQEREKTAALVQDATTARQELTASTVQHRHALEEERARSAALASELATARREIEAQEALLRKAGDEAVQLKQAAESAMAELRQRGQAVEQKPAAVEERPGVSLPAWANSDAFVKPAQTAPDVTPQNSKPAIKPVETMPLPREHAMSPDNGYSCQRYRTYDPASGSYRGYDGRRHSCP